MKELFVTLYAGTIGFCILILGIILIKEHKNRVVNRYFKIELIMIMFLILFDFLSTIPTQYPNAFPRDIIYFLNISYFVFSAFISFGWFLYSETEHNSMLAKSTKWSIISSIPCITLLILTFLSPKFQFIFYLDENSNYVRGDLYFTQIILTYGYISFTSIKAFILACNKNLFAEKQKNITLVKFAIFPLVFGVGQTVIYQIPMISLGITLSCLLVHLDFLESRISIDTFTNLNNKQHMISHLSKKIQQASTKSSFSVMMLDLDDFKQINDSYGHTIGDDAILLFCEILKYVCNKNNCYLSRYGGDEFTIISNSSTDADCQKIIDEIYTTVEKTNCKLNKQYKLKASVGYTIYTPEIKTIPELIELADKNLYKVKKQRKMKIA